MLYNSRAEFVKPETQKLESEKAYHPSHAPWFSAAALFLSDPAFVELPAWPYHSEPDAQL